MHSKFWPFRSMKTRPVSASRDTATPRDWLSFRVSRRPMMSEGRRCDWSSTKGLASASSAAAVCETQVPISRPPRSVRFTHSWKSCPTR